MNKVEIHRMHSTCGGHEKYICNISWKNMRGKSTWETYAQMEG
jgi:hypothetical protein